MAGPPDTAAAATRAPEAVLAGTLERVVYRDPQSHFTVARLVRDEGGEPVTIVGCLFEVHEGEWLRVEGSFEVDRSYGRQLRVKSYEAATPTSAVGIARYLGAGLVKGIGGELARRIVARFGKDTLHILEAEPDRLFEVEGIGKKRQRRLVEAWSEHREARRVMVFLRGHGIGAAHAARIVKAYGEQAIERVTRNPYRLADDIWGIGFRIADQIGRSVGLARDAPERADAGVRHALTRAAEEGHVCRERGALVEEAAELLELDHEAVEAAVDRLREAGLLVEEGWRGAGPGARPARAGSQTAEPPPPDDPPRRWVWLRHLHLAEATLALGLVRLARARSTRPSIHTARAIAWAEERRGIQLAESQRDALAACLGAKVAVITGGPGVGKTTILGALLDILEAKKVRVRLAAPTGRAAQRLLASTGREALTIHRLLRWNPRAQDFEHDANHPLEGCDALVVDEASMVDVVLMHRLVAALPPATHLLLVGDADQLPSVGPGAVLGHVIASGAVPVARLTEVHRQAGGSRIIRAAHAVLAGEAPELVGPWHEGDLHFIDAATPEEALATVRRLCTEDLPRRFGFDPVRDIQVLAPMRRGAAGIAAINQALGEAAAPRPAGGGGGASPGALERGGRRFAAGSRVIQLKNDYDREVWNGDVGVVTRVDAGEGELWVQFEDREVHYAAGDLDELDLAWAVSIHKAQGSEYPCVVVPLLTEHFLLLRRQLLYTAITRARRELVLVGQRRALHIAVRQASEAERASFLAARLALASEASATRDG